MYSGKEIETFFYMLLIRYRECLELNKFVFHIFFILTTKRDPFHVKYNAQARHNVCAQCKFIF